MYKIKLSILLLISLAFFSCTSENYKGKNLSFSLDYIGGEYDGVILSNILENHLRSQYLFDVKSNLLIKSSINHSQSLFITNIDNTSDRENIETSLSLDIFNTKLDCPIFNFADNISQFYIYASGEKFISNTKAIESIKYNNTEELVKKFINKLRYIDTSCDE
tara:strand:- start:297 stop:785 length:489 start_codon:yes stop_codon:yes gene_type:complete